MKRTEFLAQLKATYEQSGRTNTAIAKHIAKVEAMDEEQFVAHHAKLEALKAQMAGSVKRMAAGVMKKVGK